MPTRLCFPSSQTVTVSGRRFSQNQRNVEAGKRGKMLAESGGPAPWKEPDFQPGGRYGWQHPNAFYGLNEQYGEAQEPMLQQQQPGLGHFEQRAPAYLHGYSLQQPVDSQGCPHTASIQQAPILQTHFPPQRVSARQTPTQQAGARVETSYAGDRITRNVHIEQGGRFNNVRFHGTALVLANAIFHGAVIFRVDHDLIYQYNASVAFTTDPTFRQAPTFGSEGVIPVSRKAVHVDYPNLARDSFQMPNFTLFGDEIDFFGALAVVEVWDDAEFNGTVVFQGPTTLANATFNGPVHFNGAAPGNWDSANERFIL